MVVNVIEKGGRDHVRYGVRFEEIYRIGQSVFSIVQ